MDKLIIMASGSGSRWNNYIGVPKHLVEIDGERILDRIVRLFKGFAITIIGNDERYEVEGARLIIPKEAEGANVNERCMEFKHLWNKNGRTVVVLGDCYITDEAAQTIISEDSGMKFFGRENGSRLTGCNWGEMFAHSFYAEDIKEYEDSFTLSEALYKEGKTQRNEWWEHYRVCDGQDPTKHTVGDRFIEIDDMTDDFDKPEDYDNFMRNYEPI